MLYGSDWTNIWLGVNLAFKKKSSELLFLSEVIIIVYPYVLYICGHFIQHKWHILCDDTEIESMLHSFTIYVLPLRIFSCCLHIHNVLYF